MAPWPYPFWIAHRGAGKLAPENTLAAFRVGASHGYREQRNQRQEEVNDVEHLPRACTGEPVEEHEHKQADARGGCDCLACADPSGIEVHFGRW